MLGNLKDYQERFFANHFLESVKKSPSKYLLGLFSRTQLLMEGKLIYTDPLDMEACHIPYEMDEFRWKKTPNEDEEWIFMLNRQAYLLDLALLYALEEKEVYLAKWKELVFHFITEEGVPSEENWMCWRPLDSGLRLSNWLRSLVYFPRNCFNQEEWKLLEDSMHLHCQYLESHFNQKYYLSNWGILALTGPALFYLLNGEAPENLWGALEEAVDLQFTNKGVHWEQSPLYHHEVLCCLSWLLQVAEILNVSLPFDLRNRASRAAKAATYLCDQEGILLALHDSDPVDVGYIMDYYRGLQLCPDYQGEDWGVDLLLGACFSLKQEVNSVSREIHRKQLINEKQAVSEPFLIDNEAGLLVMKTRDWYISFFNGLHGSSHGQACLGSITLTYRGYPILIDSGRYSYRECWEREQLNREAAHNSLAFKGEEGTQIKGSWQYERLAQPLNLEMKDFGDGWYGQARWMSEANGLALFSRRVLFFEKLKCLLILDQGKSSANQTLISSWHFAPPIHLYQEKDGVSLKMDNLLDISLQSNGSYRIEEAFNSSCYNQLETHKVLRSNANMGEIAFLYTTISLEESVSVEEIPIYQSNTADVCSSCLGLRLSNGQRQVEIFVNGQDIVKGDKLLTTKEGHQFYGELVIFQENQRIRLK